MAIDDRAADRAVSRLAERDSTLFADPDVAFDRLGWIGLPAVADASADGLAAYAAQVIAAGITDVIVLGMGGSSLAPLVFERVFGAAEGHPALHVLDTTVPAGVLELMERLDPAATLVVVSSKSGTTIEPLSLAAILDEWMSPVLGDRVGSHFVAITDPGSPLEDHARERAYARVFHAPADVGGRFAALTTFAMVPAALLGLDVRELASYAAAMEESCSKPGANNPGQALGSWMADALLHGRDKLTIVCSPSLAPFGLWVEQLVAESTGKNGRGILPVLENAPGLIEAHNTDRLTFVLRTEDDADLAVLPERLAADEPVFESVIEDPYALGAQFVLWEWAVALASALVDIEPFDQPDVEEAKVAARRIANEGTPGREATVLSDGIAVVSSIDEHPASLAGALERLLPPGSPGSYLAVLAYLPERDEVLEPLRDACARLSVARQEPAVFQIGPRYLHSTGQLHKGGPDGGRFIVVTARDSEDIPVPGAPFTLGALCSAQAAGDTATLASRGRDVVAVVLPAADAASARLLSDTLVSLA